MKEKILAILISGLWITASEFFRNEIIFGFLWVDHFTKLGLEFNTMPLKGILWGIWSFILAYIIYRLLTKFDLKTTIWLSWLAAFIMMWITAFNLQVLPLRLIIFAVPLSLIEISIASLIINGMVKPKI